MKKDHIFGYLFLAAAAALLYFILVKEAAAVKELGTVYADLSGKQITADTNSLIYYDDGLLISLAYGTNDDLLSMAEYLQDRVMNFDLRIMAVGVIYTALITALSSWFIADRLKNRKRGHILVPILCAAAVYGIFLAFVFGMMAAHGVPVYLSFQGLLLPLLGLCSVMAGSCALALWLSSSRHPLIPALTGMVLLAVTYFFGCLSEEGLLTGSISGFTRIAALALEILDPFSATTLPLVVHAEELTVPPLVLLLYSLKDLCWILLPVLIKKTAGIGARG